MQDLLEVGRQFGLSNRFAKTVAAEVYDCVYKYLGEKYLKANAKA